MLYKTCSVCDWEKPVTDFYSQPKGVMGVRAACKICIATRLKRYRKDYTDKQRQRVNARQRANSKNLSGRFNAYKASAKVRGITFRLTKGYFETNWQRPCSYCGAEILTIGLDRKDNDEGYLVSNVVSCCEVCNRMKLAMTTEDWYNQMAKILAFNSKTEKV